MEILTGTSGFSYKEWKGAFYPANIKPGDMLSYYSTRLPAVEINNTFYRLPRASVLEDWAGAVPSDFRFILKASRRITHFKRLNDVEDVTSYLIETIRALGDKLGPVLFQLPPNFRKDAGRLRDFLAILPGDLRAAFEFRHPEWHDDEIFGLLGDRNAALCVSDSDGEPCPVVATADWGYLRLRREDYSNADLDEWAKRIAAQPWQTAFVMFKHEDDAAGPLIAEGFRTRF